MKTNRTRILVVILCVLMLVMALPLGSAAAKGSDNGKGSGNGYGYSRGSDNGRGNGKGGDRRAEATLDQMVEAANAKIEKLVAYAQSTPQNDVKWLLKQVDKTVNPVFRYARKIGAVVICTYTEYYIDGQYVLIDPLKVVNYRR